MIDTFNGGEKLIWHLARERENVYLYGSLSLMRSNHILLYNQPYGLTGSYRMDADGSETEEDEQMETMAQRTMENRREKKESNDQVPRESLANTMRMKGTKRR